MKKTDYNGLSIKDLNKKMVEFREQIQGLRFKLAANQLKDVRSVRVIRKEIARLQTALAAKE
ncbi:MAG: 50S ribosomal protein L29 [bacterium]|nr:50S ribosomal protein L29 [bacterium]